MSTAIKTETAICNETLAKYDLTMKDWGFQFMADTELDALRIAYIHRFNRYGTKIEYSIQTEKYVVTVFNKIAHECGLNQ